MTALDWFVVAMRVVAIAGMMLAFFPSLVHVFERQDSEVRRTRIALSMLLVAFSATQAYSMAFRLWDYASPVAGAAVAAMAAAAGIACVWAFRPWRREV